MFKALAPRTDIAIDFGTDRTRLVQLSLEGLDASIDAAAEFDDSPFAVSGAEITIEPGFVHALRRVLKTGGFAGRRCALTVPCSALLVDTAELPSLAKDELLQGAIWEAVDRFGLDRDALHLGTLQLGSGSRSGGATEHLLVGIRRQVAMALTDCVARVGLEPSRIEAAPLAALRTAWRGMKMATAGGCFAALHLEEGKAGLSVMLGSGLAFHRAFDWKPASRGDAQSDWIPVGGDDPGTAQVFRWYGLAEETLQCFRHIDRKLGGVWPSQLVLTGPAATDPALTTALSSVCSVHALAVGLAPGVMQGVLDPMAAPCTWSAVLGSALTGHASGSGRRAA
jgi:hypothetical protein